MSEVGLLSLPAELRLMIYGHAVTQCLADGYATDLRGITLCCRTIHQEIEKEFLVKVWRLLRAKHEWESMYLSGPLRLEIGNDTNFRNRVTDVTITVPVLDSWLSLLSFYFLGDEQDYQRLVDILRPLFRMPWATVTIQFDSLSKPSYDLEQYRALFRTLIDTIEYFNISGPIFRSTDQLILNLGNLETRVDRSFYTSILCITHAFPANTGVLPKARRALVSLKTDGSTKEWSIAFEFNRGPEKQTEGRMWEFKKTGNRWNGRRLFSSMDDLASDDDVEEDHFEYSDE
jgi:hypothetical protein